ncbi:MAG TPA: TetR/AcrR family transcriptional regulator [Acidimicrobiales bacterium]|jgi:AcrR family transcriptional regulator|nr:TetR/AcrR family transcriptional regulator [Acidimicrobiales bacterium]
MASGRTRETTGQRRREILDATLDTFIDVGESGTFIQEVCSRAEVSVGTLYHHFGSKDQLIATLHYTLLDEYQSGAGPILGADPPAEAGVRDTVAYHVRWLVDHPRPATFLLQQPFAGYRSGQVPADLVQQNDDFLATVHRWLDQRMAAGDLRPLPFDVVVALLIGPLHNWVRGALWFDADRAARKSEAAIAALSDGAWHSLRP